MADLAKRLDEVVGSVAIVFNDQKAHGDPVRLRIGHPAERALPVNIRISGHRSHQFQTFRWQGQCPPAGIPRSYARGWRKPPPPQRPHPGGGDGCQGWSSDRKRVHASAARRSVISRDGRDARPVEVGPPAGATDAGSTSSKLLSAAAKRQGDKARVVTLLHADQHAALAFRSRAGDDIAHIGRRRNRFAGNFHDDIACREAMVGGHATRTRHR